MTLMLRRQSINLFNMDNLLGSTSFLKSYEFLNISYFTTGFVWTVSDAKSTD